MEILTYKPKYAEFTMGDRQQGRLEMKKLTDRPMQKEVGITVDINTGAVGGKRSAANMPTVGWGFGLLVIFGGYQEANTFEEGYQ